MSSFKYVTHDCAQSLINNMYNINLEIDFLEKLRLHLFVNRIIEFSLGEFDGIYIASDISSPNKFYIRIDYKKLILLAYILNTDVMSLRKALKFPLDNEIVFAITEESLTRLDNLLNQCPPGGKSLLLYALSSEPANQHVAYADLPAPCEWEEDIYLSEEEVKAAEQYFQKFVDVYDIKVVRPATLNAGACYSLNTIHVPEIEEQGDFLVCLHEVGHLVLGTSFRDIVDEYKAEQFALEHARLFGLDTTVHEMHAKRYVFTFAQKQHQNGTVWMELYDEEWSILTDWLGITEAMWSAERLKLL